MNGLETEFADRINVVRLNVAEPANARIQAEMGLRGHPSLALLDEEGEIARRFFGAPAADVLRRAVQEITAE